MSAAIGAHEIPIVDAFPSGLTWVVILGLHLRRRSILAIAVHTIPVLAIFAFLAAFRIDRTSSSVLLLGSMICSSCASFLLALESLAMGIMRKYVNSFAIFAYYTTGFTLLITFFCAVFPSLAYGRIHFPAVIFGLLVGVWAGLYQAVVASKPIGDCRIANISMRYVTLAGLFGAIVAPIANEVGGMLNGVYLIQPKLSPIAGLATATITFIGLWIKSLNTGSK